MLNVKVTRDVTFGTLRYCFSHFCCTECGLLFSIVLKQKVKLRSLLSGRWPISDADDLLFNIKMHQKCCWLLVDRWPLVDGPTVDRYCVVTQSTDLSGDRRPTVGKDMQNSWPTLTDCRPTVGRYVDRQSTDYRPTVGRCIDRQSVDSRPTGAKVHLVRNFCIIWKWQTSNFIFVFCLLSHEKNWHKLRKVYWIWPIGTVRSINHNVGILKELSSLMWI